jgi:hypothetical protein
MARWNFARGARAALIAIAVASCGIFDFDVNLSKQTFTVDFGQQTGTMPAVACTSSAGGACDTAATFNVDSTGASGGVPSTTAVTLGCDDASHQCYAQVTSRAVQTMSVLQDNDFSSKVARHAVSFVKVADVAYTIPSNTLTFDVPKADVYAGPAGATSETDAGVALLGSTEPIKAGTTVTTPLHLIVDDNNPARSVIEHAVEHKLDFVFIVVISPRLDAGQPVPAGAIQITVAPKLTVGL